MSKEIQQAEITVVTICEALGAQHILKRVGVGKSALSNAKRDNEFPANWFGALEHMCLEVGIKCPRSLFNFRSLLPVAEMPAQTTPDHAQADLQPEGKEYPTQGDPE